MTVGWDDIEAAAKQLFNVWTNGGDLDWAKEAWGHLSNAGLTNAFSFVDRTLVNLRLVTLAKVYQDFARAKWDENLDRSFSQLAESLEVDRLALGLFAASSALTDDWAYHEDKYDLYEAALAAAVESLRPELFKCLCNAYGDVTSLYRRLCKTVSPILDDEDADAVEDDDSDDFEVTGQNEEAYLYVTQGFRR